MCMNGAGMILVAPTAASAAAAGTSSPQSAALSPLAATAPRSSASPSSDSGSPVAHETEAEEKVRRMKLELKNLEISWVCNEGQPLPQLETPLKSQN
jgi:hypothetical protein